MLGETVDEVSTISRLSWLALQEAITLEAHGGRTLTGVCTRVALRLLALAAGLVHNQQIGNPGRHFATLGY